MSELITLHGGPADGQQYRWDGGDVLQFHAFEAVRITPLGEAARPPAPSVERHATYRRSSVTRSAFVYQP